LEEEEKNKENVEEEDRRLMVIKRFLILIAYAILFIGGAVSGFKAAEVIINNKVRESITLGFFLYDQRNEDGTFSSEKKAIYKITMENVVVAPQQTPLVTPESK
jgi:hypothetical protein